MSSRRGARVDRPTNRPKRSKKDDAYWGDVNERFFIQLIYQEFVAGKLLGSTFTTSTWNDLVNAMRANCPVRFDYTVDQLKGKYNRLKVLWRHIKLGRSKTGVGVDPVTGKLDFDEERWAQFAKEDPAAVLSCKRGCPDWELLEEMWHNRVATGDMARYSGQGGSDSEDEITQLGDPEPVSGSSSVFDQDSLPESGDPTGYTQDSSQYASSSLNPPNATVPTPPVVNMTPSQLGLATRRAPMDTKFCKDKQADNYEYGQGSCNRPLVDFPKKNGAQLKWEGHLSIYKGFWYRSLDESYITTLASVAKEIDISTREGVESALDRTHFILCEIHPLAGINYVKVYRQYQTVWMRYQDFMEFINLPGVSFNRQTKRVSTTKEYELSHGLKEYADRKFFRKYGLPQYELMESIFGDKCAFIALEKNDKTEKQMESGYGI